MKLSEMRDSKAPSRKVLQIVLMIAGDQVTVSVLEPAAHHHILPEGKISGPSTYLRACN
jgi:hypothetical protein